MTWCLCFGGPTPCLHGRRLHGRDWIGGEICFCVRYVYAIVRRRPRTHARHARRTAMRDTHSRIASRGDPRQRCPVRGTGEVGANRPITTSDTPPTRCQSTNHDQRHTPPPTRSEKWPEKHAAFIRKSHIDDASRGASRASRVLNTHSKYTRRIYTYITPK